MKQDRGRFLARVVAGRLCICGLVLVAGCIGGGRDVRGNARSYLKKHGYPESLTEAVIKGEPLGHGQVAAFSKCCSVDVRWLVASNPTLSHEEIEIFIHDADGFVRGGAARNQNLSPRQVEELIQQVIKDASLHVEIGLAGNPSLTPETLMRIHRELNPRLLWFACNPECPEPIKEAIRSSDQGTAKDWLETVDYWKRIGSFRKEEDGRWYNCSPHYKEILRW